MAYNSSHASPGASGMKSSQQVTPQEFSIRVPKNNKKKFHVMRFNSNLSVDFVKWKTQNMQVKMERENNLKEFKGVDEEMPKFGAGSEFGREQREEARRKKYGYVARKYKPEDQPWILKQGGKSGKKFKGIREGGVSDNTAYYVFTQAGNGIIEAYPLQEWYKFQPIQRYKSLSAEEAEAEFGRRNKIINYFSLMMKKRLRNEEDGELDDPDEVKGKKGGSKKKDKGELKISEMDDWVDSDEFSDSDEEAKKSDEDEDDGRKKNKKKGPKKGAPKKKKKDSDDEAIEESDDGDEEGRELDYISDSSESASDHEMKANKELKGVAEEDALRKLLNSESEDEEENEEKKDEEASNSEDEESKNKKEKDEKDGGEKTKEESSKKKKPSRKDKKSNSKNDKKANKKNDGESSSELSPNSTDTDSDSAAAPKNKPSNKTKDATNSAGSSRSATPTPAPVPGEKRKLTPSELAVAAAKKAKLESSSSSGSLNLINNGDSGITEDAVRRYLMRKPMTATELLQKFKSKKSGLTSEQMVNVVTQILKNINPHKQIIKNKMYLSLSPT